MKFKAQLITMLVTLTKRKTHKFNLEDASKRERDKTSLGRYAHYYERWESNKSSRKQAHKDLHQIQMDYFNEITDVYGESEAQLRFITEAWQLIIECRRVLNWTYA